MSMKEPSLMKSATFMMRTTFKGAIARSNLKDLDGAIRKMDVAPLATTQNKIIWLRRIIAECAAWRASKAHKLAAGPNQSQRTVARAQVVDQVANEAIGRLRYLLFNERKNQKLPHVPSAQGVLRSLQGGHQQEGAAYHAAKALSAKQVNFPGGSLIDASMTAAANPQAFQNMPPNVAAIINGPNAKGFAQLSQQEFVALGKYFDANNMTMQLPVHYADKRERVDNLMIVVINGQIQKQCGIPYSTVVDMWAMDKYGNFMCTAPAPQQGDTHQYNHSSLNAGHDVICAGTVTITNGIIMEIDNQSGHYLPTRTNLRTAVEVLHHDIGAPFDNNCIVRNYSAPRRQYTNWRQFCDNQNSPGVAF